MKKEDKSDIPFSNLNRAERIGKSMQTVYDLIVIGGGVTGAGIALDASLRGLSTLLVEKKDFASGTSSKSTKLIHGGLRYLKQFEIGLVKESGLERAVAHRNIPHLVHPEKMLLPIVHKGSFSKIAASFAISIYDWLAKVPAADRKVSFNKRETLKEEPLLNEKLLKSAIQYSEYRTDDARLTMELVKAARRNSAEAYNYMEVSDFIYKDDKVYGVKCLDLLSNNKVEFKGRQVVSAAGPWVDILRDLNNSKKGKTLQLTKGVHIVVPKEKLPISSSVYFDVFDGRLLFAIPRGKVTYIGTSDTQYKGDMDKVLCTNKDAEYILKAVNNMFNIDPLLPEDIISTWAGLRPLIHEDGKSPSELSRKDEVFISDTNLISIAGGKLTGYRKMAERIVDLVQEKISIDQNKKCQTEDYDIHSDSFLDYEEFEKFIGDLKSKYEAHGVSHYRAWYLATTYGKHAELIINQALELDIPLEKALLKSEIKYGIEYESCYMPDDYFNRRSGKIYFDIETLKANLDFIISEFSTHFSWNQEKITKVKKESINHIEEVTIIT